MTNTFGYRFTGEVFDERTIDISSYEDELRGTVRKQDCPECGQWVSVKQEYRAKKFVTIGSNPERVNIRLIVGSCGHFLRDLST